MSHRASVRQLPLACASVLQDSRAKLAVLFTAAVTIGLLVTNGSAAAGTMFQSPTSPVESPLAPPAATAPPAPSPTENPPAVEQAPPPADGEEPAEPVPPASEQQPPLEPAPQPSPVLEPQEQSFREVRPSDPNAGDSSNMVLDQAEFIDSVVVSFAYVWLCCGVALILVIPLIFLFLQIRGRSKIQKEGP